MELLELVYHKPVMPFNYNYPKKGQPVLWRDGFEVWRNLDVEVTFNDRNSYMVIVPGGKRRMIWAFDAEDALEKAINYEKHQSN